MSLSPQTRRRQQQIARWVRAVPGYRVVQENLLPRIRRNQVLTDVVWRVFSPGEGVGHVDAPMHPGHVTGPDASRLPVVLVLATGLGTPEVEQLLAQVADLQRRHPSFRPLLVLDRPDFAAAREHGYVVELVLSPDAWASGSYGEGAYEDYLGRRLAALTEHYRVWHLARVARGDDGRTGVQLDPLDAAVLAHVGERLPPGLEVLAAD